MLAFMTLDGDFGNPASRSQYGWQAEKAVEEARSQGVANLVNCDPREIVWLVWCQW